MACYGLEQFPTNPLCPTCPHKTGCAELMDHLAGRIKITEAAFRFVPPLLEYRYTVDEAFRIDLDRSNIEKVYAFCHEWVFGYSPKSRIGKYEEAIMARVVQAETSLKLFFLANMYGWKQSKQTPFYAKVLTMEHAIEVLHTFAKTCDKAYGVFDTTTLDRLNAREGDMGWIEDHLLNSEVIAGSWIVNYKLFNSGDIETRLYRECEEALHPYWLAIETSYWVEVFRKHLAEPNPNLATTLKRHRSNVSNTIGKLKKEPLRSVMAFTGRERIMPKAIEKVLALRGLSADDFLVEPGYQVRCSIRFWTALAIAVQHVECLRFVNKIPSAFDGIGIGSAQTHA